MGDVLQQLTGGIIAIAVALAACVAYFWGTNWLLDRFLNSNNVSGSAETKRDQLRDRIRPWLFLAPALLFLTVYLIYPVFETLRLSLLDKTGRNFVGFANYAWALSDSNFQRSILNNIM
ncbi:MAG: alpha-glucoside ABC transporter permease, partial [Cypionkella sp.]